MSLDAFEECRLSLAQDPSRYAEGRGPGDPALHELPTSGAGLLPHLERLDDVADLDVVEVAERDAALEALADLGGVFLEPAEAGDGEVLRHHSAVAEEPRLAVAPDEAGPDDAARDVAEP